MKRRYRRAGAFEDAQLSAQSEGFYGACTIVDQQVFETFTDPYFGHLFFAQITADCDN